MNALHVIYSAKVILPLLLDRYKSTGTKSALIVTSSGMGSRPIPGFTVYSATKSLVSFIAEGLHYELEGKVDVMSYQAGEVKTKMMAGMRENYLRMTSVQSAVSSCFRDIGYTPLTYGAFRHELGMLALSKIPFTWT